MKTYMEEIFRKKAKDSDNEILVAQWEYDKQLVGNALRTVGNIFPHYSLHDESHSITILNNLVNVLGKQTVEFLSCTDLWLILESAYCHDLGMVITADMIQDAMKGAFQDFIERHNQDNSSPLYEYASLYEIKSNKILLKDAEFSVQSHDAIKYLLAAYFRGWHGVNSQSALCNPVGRLSLPSPRVLIPKRLYQALGAICLCHTKSFEEVMKLPYVENGLTVDLAHPRFIACLLRIGDLLDVDNNRFSDVLQRTIAEMPADSLLHREKHYSISHLRIEDKHIEISAKCPTPQVAKVTYEWFEWIEQEFKLQTQYWNQIVPNDLHYYLPNVDKTDVDIDGYDSVSTKNNHRFTIDSPKALELLKGQNLYSTPFDSIRELLQNAVDSTLIRYYLDNKNSSNFPEGVNDDLLTALSDYTIEVEAKKRDDGSYSIMIADQGIGLKRSQLSYLTNTGSSSKNTEKNQIVREMPDWLRPSGTFGIGFQSVFLLTDCVNIETKDYFTDDCYGLEMYNPNSKMNGDIYVKKIKRLSHTGFNIRFDTIPCEKKQFPPHDPFLNVSIDEMEDDVKKRIYDYAAISIVPIRVNGILIKRNTMDYYDKETGIELLIPHRNSPIDFVHHIIQGYFKNAFVSDSPFENFKYLNIHFNLHKGTADEFLNISRTQFKAECRDSLKQKVLRAIANYILSDSFSNRNLIELSFFRVFALFYDLGNDVLNKLDYQESCVFDLVTTKDNIPQFTYESIRKAKSLIIKTISKEMSVFCTKNEGDEICIEGAICGLNNVFTEVLSLLIKMASKCFKNCYLKRVYTNTNAISTDLQNIMPQCFMVGHEYIFDNTDVVDTEFSITDLKTSIYHFSPFRCYFLYVKGYEDLLIPANIEDTKNFPLFTSQIPNNKVARILSPFSLSQDKCIDARTDDFYKYVHSMNGKPIENIKVAYDRFVKEFNEMKITVAEDTK